VSVALTSEVDATGRPTEYHVPIAYHPGEGIRRTDARVPTGPDALNPLLDSGQSVVIADVNADARVPDVLRREQVSAGRPALVLIPLIVGRQRIGNLILTHDQPHHWSETELRLFRSSANQIAVSIENARRFERERERTERLRLIARVGQRIAARLETDELLLTTAEALHQRLGYDHVSIFLLDPNDATMLEQRARASRWPKDPDEVGMYRQSIERGILGSVARHRMPEIVNDVSRDPRYISPSPDIRAELAVPILLGTRLWGVLDVCGTRPFREDDQTGLSIVADQLAIALENATLYERAQAAAVLEERQRLARDLHDSVTQLIFSITLVAQSIPAAYHRSAAEGQQRLGRVVELSQQALSEMRALLAELRPESVIREGLLPALHKQIQRVTTRDSIQIELHADTYQPHSLEYEEALYRVVQESLNNVVKHAGAERVTIELGQSNGYVELRIGDDGRGFDPAQPRASGLGLVGMRERIERLGGTLSIQSQLGAGVVIQARLPEQN
jgi:signal transduction histidine kinase